MLFDTKNININIWWVCPFLLTHACWNVKCLIKIETTHNIEYLAGYIMVCVYNFFVSYLFSYCWPCCKVTVSCVISLLLIYLIDTFWIQATRLASKPFLTGGFPSCSEIVIGLLIFSEEKCVDNVNYTLFINYSFKVNSRCIINKSLRFFCYHYFGYHYGLCFMNINIFFPNNREKLVGQV